MSILKKIPRFTVVLLDGQRSSHKVVIPNRIRLTSMELEEVLAHEATRVEEAFPGRAFRLVPLADGNFNFVEMSKEEAELQYLRAELGKEHSEATAV
jgi:hypothetical protein